MTKEEFEQLVADEFPNAVPEKFRDKIKNVAFLVEDQPSLQLRRRQRLRAGETLLGFYQGIPTTVRGDHYGIGNVLPDTITLYQHPIEGAALYQQHSTILENIGESYENRVRKVIRDTIWHEVAHHFGYNEHQVRTREAKRK
jgi:predicted Zn-dependent protease with MMP-like domain